MKAVQEEEVAANVPPSLLRSTSYATLRSPLSKTLTKSIRCHVRQRHAHHPLRQPIQLSRLSRNTRQVLRESRSAHPVRLGLAYIRDRVILGSFPKYTQEDEGDSMD